MLSDIRTLIDGGRCFEKGELKPILEGAHGAGNVSIPVLMCTGLELASALYTDNRKSNAIDNVRRFIKEFFPADGKEIPGILWDGIRNGTSHVFIPNTMTVPKNRVEFVFFVNHNSYKPSYITRSKGKITLHINSFEFYHILKQAIEKYKSKLEKDNKLQLNFIAAWKSKQQPHK